MNNQKKTWLRIVPWLEAVFGSGASRAFYYKHRDDPGFPKARYIGNVPFLAVEDGLDYIARCPTVSPLANTAPVEPGKRKRGRPRKIQAADESTTQAA